MTASLFRPTADGYDISAAGVLLLLADTVHGDPAESTAAGRERAMGMVRAMIKAARAGGFAQADILETLLLAQGELTTPRVRAMAVQACEAAGADSLCKIFDAMRAMRKP